MAAGTINPNTQSLRTTGQTSAYGATVQNNNQSGPYRGGLMTNFDWEKNLNSPGSLGQRYGAPDTSSYNFQANQVLGRSGNMDSDVQNAASAYNQLIHPNSGTNGGEQSALFNMYLSRINQKNALSSQINNQGDKQNALNSVYGSAAQAVTQGTKKTDENYSSRGLLYSGLRQGAEQKVKAGVGAKLSSDVAGTNREFENSAQAAKAAYASIGLQNAQQNLTLANQAFDTVSKNNIARLQAYQQFGQGIGYVAGAIYGGYKNSGGGNSGLMQPELGSQYGNTSNYNVGGGNMNYSTGSDLNQYIPAGR